MKVSQMFPPTLHPSSVVQNLSPSRESMPREKQKGIAGEAMAQKRGKECPKR